MEPRLKELLDKMVGSGTIRNMSASEGNELVDMVYEMDEETHKPVSNALIDVQKERDRQDEKWGGSDHDDTHCVNDWVEFICTYAQWAKMMWRLDSPDKFRRRMIQVAALAVASCESFDRNDLPKKTTDSRWIMCGLCDTAYDPADTKEAAIHDHPEPQSGEPRDAWIKSKMKYSEWIIETDEGKSWANRVRGKG
jgi:hypothetical protein